MTDYPSEGTPVSSSDHPDIKDNPDNSKNSIPKPFGWPPHFPWDQKAGPGTTVGRPDTK